MPLPSRKSNTLLITGVLSLLAVFAVFQITASTATAAPPRPQADLAAKGKERFTAYKCGDCHGDNGEGTADGPDLTHSHKTADQVSAFLAKPSSDAVNKGMPDIPKNDPDHAA